MSTDKSKDYMFKMQEWELSEIEGFFKRINLVDDIEKKLFRFLVDNSTKFDDDSQQVDYSQILETVLTWASNPNNLRSYPHFPKGMEVLKNKYKPLLEKLGKIGLLKILARKSDGKKVIYLQPESQIKLTADKITFDNLLVAIRLSYQQMVKGDVELLKANSEPFKLLQQIEVSSKVIEYKQFNRSLLKLTSGQAVVVSFEEDGLTIPLVFETVNDLYSLVEKVAKKLFYGILDSHDEKVVIFRKRLDYLLIDLHRSKDPSTQTTFIELYDNLDEEHGFYSANYEAWLSLIWKMVSELPLGTNSGFSYLDRVCLQLLFGWITYDYDLTQKAKAGEKMLSSVNSKIIAYQRLFTRAEIFNFRSVIDYSKKYGEKSCQSIFDIFLAEKSFEGSVESLNQAILSISLHTGELFYLSGKSLVVIYRKFISKAKDKKYGFKKIYFYNGWGDKLTRDVYDERIVKAMADDNDFFDYLDIIIKDREPHLHALHELLSGNPRLAIAFCDAEKISLEFLFNVTGKVKPINVMLDIYRMQVLKKLRKEVSFWTKIFIKVKSLFRFKKASSGMLGTIDRALQKSKISVTSNNKRKQFDGALLRDQVIGKEKKIVAKDKKKVEKKVIVSPKDELLIMHDLIGKSLDDLLKELHLPEGITFEKSKSYIERIVAERISFEQKELNAGTVEKVSYSIATDPRLRKFIEKDKLQKYISLLLIESLGRKNGEG